MESFFCLTTCRFVTTVLTKIGTLTIPCDYFMNLSSQIIVDWIYEACEKYEHYNCVLKKLYLQLCGNVTWLLKPKV